MAQKFANATPNDTGNHGAHYDSIKNGELTAVFVESGEPPEGYRHSMFGGGRLGTPLIAGSSHGVRRSLVLFRYSVNCRRTHGVSDGFGPRRSISQQYKYGGTYPCWRKWLKDIRKAFGSENVRLV